MWEWLFNFIPNLPSFFAGAISGLVTVLVKYHLDQKQRKREYTTSLLLNINSGQHLAPIAYKAFKLAESGVDFSKLSQEQVEAVEQTLDYLEFVAVCHRQQIVDTETLIRQEGTAILELFRAARPWIEDYRQRVGSNSVYHELERLVGVIKRKRPQIYGHLTIPDSASDSGGAATKLDAIVNLWALRMHLLIANKLYSSWSLRPWLAMRALGIPFTEDVIALRQPDSVVRIAKYGPTGKVPVLVDGDIAIWESLAIIEYLAEKFPDKGVWPRDRRARAHARAASNEMHAGFQPLRANCPMNLGKRFALKDYGPEVLASIARLETLWREARATFGAKANLSAGGGPFLYGAFSAADAMYAPVVTRLDSYQLPVAPDTRAYMDAILALPAFQEWKRAALAEPAAWDIADYEAGHTAVDVFRKS